MTHDLATRAALSNRHDEIERNIQRFQDRENDQFVTAYGSIFSIPTDIFPTFDAPSGQMGMLLAGCIDVIKDKVIFDIGCGAGVISVLLAKSGAKFVHAFDIRKTCVQTTKRNIIRNGIQKIAMAHESDLLDRPPEDVVPDIIYADLPFCIDETKTDAASYPYYSESNDLFDKLFKSIFDDKRFSGADLYLTHSNHMQPNFEQHISDYGLQHTIFRKIDFGWIEVTMTKFTK